MRPSLIYSLLAEDPLLAGLGLSADAIFESQSVDERPSDKDYFATVRFEENTSPGFDYLGPRTMVIAVHHPWDKGRDYSPITALLNRIDRLLLPVDQEIGDDGVRVAQIRRGNPARSGNMTDEGYKTIVRWATYRVSYDEFGS
jgi:hypothetical protein